MRRFGQWIHVCVSKLLRLRKKLFVLSTIKAANCRHSLPDRRRSAQVAPNSINGAEPNNSSALRFIGADRPALRRRWLT